MHACKVVSEGLERLHAANTQEVFLTDTGAVIATVQSCSEANKICRIVGVKGIEEVNGDDMT